MNLPSDSQRIAIVGRTGSGKTQSAAWHLSKRSFDTKPWIMFDYKGDELLNEIEGTQEIDLATVPKKPGLYIVHPLPDDNESVENYLWQIWANENIGLYFDEGYMIGDSPALRAILTQGRSKHLPVIILSQRPVWLSRFVFSESDFFQLFHLNDVRDRKTMRAFVPADLDARLPQYHSYYYDVANDQITILSPVPKREEILETFSERLNVNKRKFI